MRSALGTLKRNQWSFEARGRFAGKVVLDFVELEPPVKLVRSG